MITMNASKSSSNIQTGVLRSLGLHSEKNVTGCKYCSEGYNIKNRNKYTLPVFVRLWVLHKNNTYIRQ